MNTITDSFFQIGVTHEVCEDYTVHGYNHAILSDGCSNGGGPSIESDWGARFLGKSAQLVIDGYDGIHTPSLTDNGGASFAYETLRIAKCQLALFPNISQECLTATLLAAQMINESFVNIIIGDGVNGGKKRDGTWEIHQYEFTPGGSSNQAAPFYLKYWDSKETKQYFDQFGGSYRHTIYRGDLLGTAAMDKEEITGTLDPNVPFFFHRFNTDEFEFNFIGSDGLSSFYQHIRTQTSKRNEPVDLLDVLRVLLDVECRPHYFKIQRNWAFKRNVAGTLVRRGWHNSDDVSLGGIYCTPN